MTPGIVSVLNTPRFDSGHILWRSVYEAFWKNFPRISTLCLVQRVDTRLCVRLRRLVFLALRCFPSLSSGPRCLSSRTVWTRRSVTCGRAENCGFSAVAVPRWSKPSPSICRGSSSWSRLFSRPQCFPRRSYFVVDVPVLRSCRFLVLSVQRQSRSHSCGSSSSLSWRRSFPMVQTVADHCDFCLLVDKVVDAPVMQVVPCSLVDIIPAVVQRQIPWSRLFV